MLPTKEEALALVRDGLHDNPGPWGRHSLTAAHCGEKIAQRCGLDPEKAYILGLLHDIGRKFGTRHLGHVVDGYRYMTALGYDEAAKICLTHSFVTHSLEGYIGKVDVSPEELALLQTKLAEARYDDYDLLIQLCDCLAGAEGVVNMEARMADVKRRYGSYPQDKWDANMALRRYFEEKMGADVYAVCEQGRFAPEEGGILCDNSQILG